jgi:hypothetical protein
MAWILFQGCLGGGGYHLGTHVRGVCLQPQYLGLGAAHFLSLRPLVVLLLFLIVHFLSPVYVNIQKSWVSIVSTLSGLPSQTIASQGFGSGVVRDPTHRQSRSVPGAGVGSAKDYHNCHLPRMDATPFPFGSPSGLLPLERALEVLKFFIMV